MRRISLPTEDKFLTTRAELTETMAMTLGGRAAEEIVFSEITTGASNDLEKVTETAKQMVMRFGMSERLGPRVFGQVGRQPGGRCYVLVVDGHEGFLDPAEEPFELVGIEEIGLPDVDRMVA
ncbi:MAG TPA: hypothetical protein VD741_02120, partial [Solirubrobacterales bacterium]|nr:hypothetical protein [Solirubrobacterales bacterium]